MADTTLHLPRILCFHGGGSNARIFRMQCRALERSLKTRFRLVYVDAPFPAQPGPDVTAVYKDYGPFKAWLRINEDEPPRGQKEIIDGIHNSIVAAQRIDSEIGASGKWVGVLGFSQGAKIAASIAYLDNILNKAEFQFVVLLAGRGPLVWLDKSSAVPEGLASATAATMPKSIASSQVSTKVVSPPLRLPGIHVHGRSDPGLERHRELLHKSCDVARSWVVEWDGGHRVPIKREVVDIIVKHVVALSAEDFM